MLLIPPPRSCVMELFILEENGLWMCEDMRRIRILEEKTTFSDSVRGTFGCIQLVGGQGQISMSCCMLLRLSCVRGGMAPSLCVSDTTLRPSSVPREWSLARTFATAHSILLHLEHLKRSHRRRYPTIGSFSVMSNVERAFAGGNRKTAQGKLLGVDVDVLVAPSPHCGNVHCTQRVESTIQGAHIPIHPSLRK